MNYKISVNQLADFATGSEAKRRRIIRQQKVPNKFRVSYYQLAKARMKKAIEKHGDLEPVFKGIEELISRKPEKQRQAIDRMVSIEAMARFVNLKLPNLLCNIPHEVIKNPEIKSIIINGVEIIISPDVIIRLELDGKKYLGAVKIHVSKNNVFDAVQSRYVSTLLYKYLKDGIAKQEEEVIEELCLSIDVFGDSVISVPKNIDTSIRDVFQLCEEVKTIWNAA
ncbi:hypothetical protein DFQ11_101952 [Winogradskyella epiphytica]|uniref:Uncharacterized protein n=1 Tax=Winogradskyella epiphytica TaxID=262005 RepID=A0A2V4XBV2_9FLAO|nr:hypothetical protein [Winogradskyella epiphytica]PYE83515.1 hypothetical protein DFQ11_101952 [Winogradskyella epiphytica]GGW58723.1 hypothetical protein GCM10008085_08080 [Winogradskyella epiphytica]